MAAQLITIQQAAKHISMSVDHIRHLIRTEQLKVYKFGYRSHRIDKADLDQYIQSSVG